MTKFNFPKKLELYLLISAYNYSNCSKMGWVLCRYTAALRHPISPSSLLGHSSVSRVTASVGSTKLLDFVSEKTCDYIFYDNLNNKWHSRWSAAPNRTTSAYYDHTEKKTHAVWSSGQNGRVSRRQENSHCSSPEWVEKASWVTLHLLYGHSEERPSSTQPYLGGCYRTGSE